MENMRSLHALLSYGAVTASAALTDVDIRKNFVSPGRRQLMATAVIVPTGTDTDETSTVKLQESATTVDSDFTDISGAAFTAVAQGATPSVEQLFFQTLTTTKYLRGYHTAAGTTPAFTIAVEFFLVKRVA